MSGIRSDEAAFVAAGATLRPYGRLLPKLHAGVTLMDGARVIGDVELGQDVAVWYNTTIRGDAHWVRIGEATNIQDNSMLHATRDHFPLSIGARVTVGHAARLDGCTVEDEVLIGIGSVILNGAVVRRHAMVAAGAVVPPGMVVESGTLVAGVPARVIRELRPEEVADLPESAARYVAYASRHRAGMPGAPAAVRYRA